MNQDQRDALLERVVEAHTSATARAWDIGTKLAVPGVIALVGWLWLHEQALNEHTQRLGVIEDSRFTASDAALLEGRMFREYVARLDAINQTLATLAAEVRGLKERIDRDAR